MKKRMLIILLCVLASLGVLCNVYVPDNKINNTIADMQEIVQEEIKQEIAEENQSTIEIPVQTITDEEELEKQEVENEAFELQGEIAYNGDAKSWNISTGNTPQLTYISQIDSRWKYHSYTSIGDSSQTIGSSGCGVASAAMIIDSIVGIVSVTELADTFVVNGYRSANSGTYWSAYRAVADQFNIEYKETDNFDTMLNLLRNNHYIIASCGNGLFTSGGHYIVLYGIDGDTIKIYDPYLYSGKFETTTRRNKVTVSGNTVYCSTDNFRKYANYKQFFCYGYNTDTTITTNSTDDKVTTETYTRYVNTKSNNLNVRNKPNGSIVGSLPKGSKVTVYETSGAWSRIGDNKWVSTSYLSSIEPGRRAITIQKKYTIGKYKVATNIHVRTGPGTNYSAKTYKQLTTNAKYQNKLCGSAYYNGYLKGVVCNVTEVKGEWGKTASGWICLRYCSKI
ncbi:MAG: SH3 domain-containing protein [Clostridia bacterium]|nr:SH3 domain-containing protein [Clostridia bacterium]